MRNPRNVLNSLIEHSMVPNYRFERLYRILFNEEMYYRAYQNIYPKAGNMTPGTDGQTIDGMSLARIEKIIGAIRNESYQPHPSRRTYIPKKNGRRRPLGIPAVDDKLVQEVIRMILEAIYENHFEHCSHGFRPRRSCHTALVKVNRTFTGTKWFVEGDIKGFYDNIDHDVLITILEERIADDRFIRLIRKFLNAGYVEDWLFHKTFSGTPQGGIMSPILANIYLDKLDKYMKEYIQAFDTEERVRKPSRLRMKYQTQKWNAIVKLKTENDVEKKKQIVKEIKAIDRLQAKTPSVDEMDANYKRLKYIRYADDFLIGVIGSKEDCKQIKQDVTNFLYGKLKLELSDEKTLITHAENPAKFLSYEVSVRKSSAMKRGKDGKLKRYYNGKTVINMPKDRMKQKLLEYGAMEIKAHNGKEQWRPMHRPMLLFNDDLEILNNYNTEIMGFYNYYSIAHNSATINAFKYIMEYSMYKTFANKYRTTIRKICNRYMKNGVFTVHFKNKKREEKFRTFYHYGFRRKIEPLLSSVDKLPHYFLAKVGTSLIDRLKARNCEMCGETNDLEMHHIRKLADIKEGKNPFDMHMIRRRRKTIALCGGCHRKVHNGG